MAGRGSFVAASGKYHLLRNDVRPSARTRLQDVFCFDEWNLNIARSLLERDQGFWLDVEGPTWEDLRLLARLMGITEGTAAAVAEAQFSERCEIHEQYMVVCLRLSVGQGEQDDAGFVTLLVFAKALVTLHHEPASPLRHLMETVRRGNAALSPERVMYLVLLENLRLWTPAIQGTEDDVESLHELALVLGTADKDDVLLRMSSTRTRLSLLQRRLLSKRDVIRGVGASGFPVLTERSHGHVRDVTDRLNDLLRTVALARDSLNQLQANYLAKISLDVAERDKDNNRSMKVFAMVATVGLPVNALAGIGGMNVYFPGRLEYTSSAWPFAIFVLLQALLVAHLVILFRWYKLL